jgi:hypothetical protein
MVDSLWYFFVGSTVEESGVWLRCWRWNCGRWVSFFFFLYVLRVFLALAFSLHPFFLGPRSLFFSPFFFYFSSSWHLSPGNVLGTIRLSWQKERSNISFVQILSYVWIVFLILIFKDLYYWHVICADLKNKNKNQIKLTIQLKIDIYLYS